MSYGEKIAALRKQRDMTQAELGKKLNVSFQAVSKWENGFSEPDLDTVKKICEIFEISVSDFFDEKAPEKVSSPAEDESLPVPTAYCSRCHRPLYRVNNFEVPDQDGELHILCKRCKDEYDKKKNVSKNWFEKDFAKETEKELPIQKSAQESASKPSPMAFCSKCKKPLYNTADFVVLPGKDGQIQRVVCYACKAKDEAKQKEEEQKRIARKREKQKKSGFAWGTVGGCLLGIILLAGQIVENRSVAEVIFWGIFGFYAGFAFLSQAIWMNSVFACLMFFVRSFRLPGVIFTLDLDGILFLLAVKIVGAILAAMLSVCCFLLGLVISVIYALFSFPFAVVQQARGEYDYD